MNNSRTKFFNILLMLLGAEMFLGLIIDGRDHMGILLTTLGLGMGIYGLKFTFGRIKLLTLALAVIALVWGIILLAI